MWRPAAIVAAFVALLAGLVIALLGTASPVHGTPPAPHPKTIVEVTGDAENGFGVHYYDGTAIFPPTRSEAIAECGEYDNVFDQVRCRVKTRTWYRDLGEMKRSLAWATS